MVAARGLTRRALALGAAAALPACAKREAYSSAPRDFGPQLAALPPLPAGQSRVVVMRDDWQPGWGEVEVTIDGQRAGIIRDGGVLARELAPGRHHLDLVRAGLLVDLAVEDITVDLRPSGTAWVRLMHFIGEGKALAPTYNASRTAGPAFNHPTPTKVQSFRFAELNGPPR